MYHSGSKTESEYIDTKATSKVQVNLHKTDERTSPRLNVLL